MTTTREDTVQTAGHAVTIEAAPAGQEVRVELAGVVLARTFGAMILHETGLPDRWYIPAVDVDASLLRPSDLHTTCPFKGEAGYWSAEVGGKVYSDLIWTYPTPIPQCTAIAGMMSFYPDRTQLFVDGKPV
ncbi:MAG TPA: DUF427 domain-containing protein [Sporichthyaceae bacterium]